jgi:hypothetical protein
VLRDHFARFAAVYDSRYAKDLGNFRIERISRVATRFLTAEYDSRHANELGNFRIERISRVATRFLSCSDYP